MIEQAILLAAGRGTRMWPLSATRPKPLIPVASRPLLVHLLDSLEGAGLREAVVVVPPGDAVRRALGPRRGRVRIRYAVEKRPLGTGHALLQARRMAAQRFLVLNGDAWAPPEELRRLARFRGHALGFRRVERPAGYGVVLRRGSRVAGLQEKPERPASREVNAGLYALDRSILALLEEAPRSPRGEIELTWALGRLLKQSRVGAVPCPRSLDVSYPWDLLALNARLLEGLRPAVRGTVEKGATLLGPVEVGPGSRIRAGAYIEGPALVGRDCDIGPNCFIRASTSIGDSVRIGNGVEVKNSIIMNRARIGHLSYVGDSVVGENCNFGAGTITANLRLDEGPVRVFRDGKGFDSGLRKLGAVLGDGVHTGIHCSLNVGTIVGPGVRLPPARLVSGEVR
ncbi:MAG: sugar phosphate nucleotidyltransferase [Halobacteria archaeon]